MYIIEAQLARLRHEEMIQAAERERRFAELPTIRVNVLENAINAFKAAFARRAVQQQWAPMRPAVAAE